MNVRETFFAVMIGLFFLGAVSFWQAQNNHQVVNELNAAFLACPENAVQSGNLKLADCNGDGKVDWVWEGELELAVLKTRADADFYNVADLKKIRDSLPPRTCPDGKKDKGDIRKDEAGVWRLWYCGKPEPYGETYLSRDTGEGNRYQQEFEKRATKQ